MNLKSLLRLACVLGVLLLAPAWAWALPRMSLVAGTPCAACHINVQGGGGRTEIGWGSMSKVGAISYDSIGLDALAEQESNRFFDNKASLGADIRFQMARFGAPRSVVENGELVVKPADRRVIPMQIQPYLGLFLAPWLKLYGTYAVGPSTLEGNLCDPIYAGQSCFEAEAIIQPSYDAPTLRFGQIQPSIGIRHDDHTMLIRADASAPRVPIIAPNYAEVGAELTYLPKFWLQLDTGVYRSKNLAEAIGNSEIVNADDTAWLGRAQLAPRIEGLPLTTYVGTSLFLSGEFQMQNYFFGLGWLNHGALMLEMSRSNRGEQLKHETLNTMVMLSVQVTEWLIAEARYERATSDIAEEEFLTQSAVFGFQFFPVPYLELRPEYRYVKTDDYASGQYAVQLHMFY